MTYENFRDTKFFRSLDGLRCVSIVAVLLYHCDSRLPGLLGTRGYMGVDLFFVISGFLITTLLLREKDATGNVSLLNFYARRTLRIFPLYYAVLLAFVGATWAIDRRTAEGREFFHHLPFFALYMNNWVIALGPKRVIFAFSWSLATEEQFYIFWPSIVASSRKRWVAPAVIASLMGATWVMQVLLAHGVFDLGEVPDRIVTSIAPAICMGCLLAFALNNRASYNALRPMLSRPWCAVVGAALVLVASMLPIEVNFVRIAMVLLVASVVVCSEHWMRPALDNRLARHIGVVSYGMYLMFTLILNVGKRLLHLDASWQKFVWLLPVTTLVATVVFRVYETPFLRLKARFVKAA